MDLSISGVRPATDEEWDRIWKQCDYATYFHSREWAKIWNNYTTGKMSPAGTMIEFSDGASALLPFSHQKILMKLLIRCVSSPAGTFGGWLSLDNLSLAHGQMLYNYIVSKYADLMWRLNPYDPRVKDIQIYARIQENTQVLELADGFSSLSSSWSRSDSSLMRKVRKARASSVIIREADSLQDWREYFKVYQETLSRWGGSATSHYKWELFQNIYDLDSHNVKLWLATLPNKIIAGALCLYARRHVVYWHGAALAEYFNLRPINLLMVEAIEHACLSGYLWFDFNPSGTHAGVEKFKKSFGTHSLACPVVSNSSNLLNFLEYLAGRNESKKAAPHA